MQATLVVDTAAIAIAVERYRASIVAAPNLPMAHFTQGVANGYLLAMLDVGAIPPQQARLFFEAVAGAALRRSQECLDECFPAHLPARVH
jgi:hypothetical protein